MAPDKSALPPLIGMPFTRLSAWAMNRQPVYTSTAQILRHCKEIAGTKTPEVLLAFKAVQILAADRHNTTSHLLGWPPLLWDNTSP